MTMSRHILPEIFLVCFRFYFYFYFLKFLALYKCGHRASIVFDPSVSLFVEKEGKVCRAKRLFPPDFTELFEGDNNFERYTEMRNLETRYFSALRDNNVVDTEAFKAFTVQRTCS